VSQGFSIIISTYNRCGLLRDSLQSILAMDVPAGYPAEILVIDNNCNDGTAEYVDGLSGNSRFAISRIQETSQGLCHCRNRGIQEAKYEYVVYLDDDIQVTPDWLHGCLEAFTDWKADCVVGPVEPLFENGIPSYMTPLILTSVTSSYSMKGDEVRLLPPEIAHEIPGCNFAVRKQVALELGGFDLELGRKGRSLLGGEDWDLGQRLVAAAKTVVYHPRCRIKHLVSAEKTAKSNLRQRWFWIGKTRRALLVKSNKAVSSHDKRHQARLAFLYLGQMVFLTTKRQTHLAFERELQARMALGYCLGKDHS
jgi:glucosyl-dolichyl phosphate glucuronosyltransferase